MTTTSAPTAQVQIISVWSKIDGLEGRLLGRDKNVEYTVEVEAGRTAEETLENAFALTNRDDRPMGRKACSTSAGDIMVLDGTHYFVEGCGFRALTAEESVKIQALTSRDTSGGYDFLTSRGLI